MDQKTVFVNEVTSSKALKKVRVADIQNLVFQGGSVKGIAYVTAYQALLDAGLQPEQLARIGGTSAGAIAAMLLSIGHTANEMLQLMQELNFRDLLDQDAAPVQSMVFDFKNPVGWNLFAKSTSRSSDSTLSKASSILKDTFGLFHGEVFRLWAEKVIQQKTKTNYLTFLELHSLHEKHPEIYRDLYITGVNVNANQAEIFSWEHTPHAIISDALRISMSIPLIFKPHFMYIKQGSKRQIDPNKETTLYIDGGVINNYPLFLFDEHKYLSRKMKYLIPSGGNFSNPETLGLRLVNKERKNFLMGTSKTLPQKELFSFLPYFMAILGTIYHKEESDHTLANEQWRTAYIDTCGVNMLDFDLSDEQKSQLMISGKTAINEFFDEDFIGSSEEDDLDIGAAKAHSMKELPLLEQANRSVTQQINQETFTQGINASLKLF